jgi:hypothetical protein
MTFKGIEHIGEKGIIDKEVTEKINFLGYSVSHVNINGGK